MDVRTALREGIAQLRAAQTPSYTLAAELLLMHALERNRAWIYAHPDEEIPATHADIYLTLVARRAAGEPTQYITSTQEFWGLVFHVEPGVLIPRPETEHVIEVTLERIGSARDASPGVRRIADVGTGSGCLAVALAREFPQATVCATDISARALAIAQQNAQRHGVSERIRFTEASLLEPFLPASSHARAVPFDLIVSNPPYIARNAVTTLLREVREHEPPEALFAGPRGDELYAPLIAQAAALLAPGGLAVLEMGHDSLPHIQPLFDGAAWCDVRVTHDLAGIPRVISAERL